MKGLELVSSGGPPTRRKGVRSSPHGVFRIVTVALAVAAIAGCARGSENRIRRLYALGRHPSASNRDRIAAFLEDPDRDVRASALVVLESVDAPRAVELARRALDDPDGLVRAAAVRVVGARPDPTLAGKLSALVVDDPVWQVRARAIEALAPADDPAVRDAYARAIGDSVKHVRRAALRGLAGHPGLVPAAALIEAAEGDSDWGNRVAALDALGESASPDAWDAVDKSAQDPNEFVRAAAAGASRALRAAAVPRPALPAPAEPPAAAPKPALRAPARTQPAPKPPAAPPPPKNGIPGV
jgi:HEAT repeat protein